MKNDLSSNNIENNAISKVNITKNNELILPMKEELACFAKQGSSQETNQKEPKKELHYNIAIDDEIQMDSLSGSEQILISQTLNSPNSTIQVVIEPNQDGSSPISNRLIENESFLTVGSIFKSNSTSTFPSIYTSHHEISPFENDSPSHIPDNITINNYTLPSSILKDTPNDALSVISTLDPISAIPNKLSHNVGPVPLKNRIIPTSRTQFFTMRPKASLSHSRSIDFFIQAQRRRKEEFVKRQISTMLEKDDEDNDSGSEVSNQSIMESDVGPVSMRLDSPSALPQNFIETMKSSKIVHQIKYRLDSALQNNTISNIILMKGHHSGKSKLLEEECPPEIRKRLKKLAKKRREHSLDSTVSKESPKGEVSAMWSNFLRNCNQILAMNPSEIDPSIDSKIHFYRKLYWLMNILSVLSLSFPFLHIVTLVTLPLSIFIVLFFMLFGIVFCVLSKVLPLHFIRRLLKSLERKKFERFSNLLHDMNIKLFMEANIAVVLKFEESHSLRYQLNKIRNRSKSVSALHTDVYKPGVVPKLVFMILFNEGDDITDIRRSLLKNDDNANNRNTSKREDDIISHEDMTGDWTILPDEEVVIHDHSDESEKHSPRYRTSIAEQGTSNIDEPNHYIIGEDTLTSLRHSILTTPERLKSPYEDFEKFEITPPILEIDKQPSCENYKDIESELRNERMASYLYNDPSVTDDHPQNIV